MASSAVRPLQARKGHLRAECRCKHGRAEARRIVVVALAQSGERGAAGKGSARLRAKELKRALRNRRVDVDGLFERRELEEAMASAGLSEADLLSAEEEEAYDSGESSAFQPKGLRPLMDRVQRTAFGLLARVNASIERRKQQVLSGELKQWLMQRAHAVDTQLNLQVKLRILWQRLRFRWFALDGNLGITSRARLYGPPALRAVNRFRETPVGQVLQVAATLWLFVSGFVFKLLGFAVPVVLVGNALAPNLLSDLAGRALNGTTLHGEMPDAFSDSRSRRGSASTSSRGATGAQGRSSTTRRDYSAGANEVIDVEAEERKK